MKLQSKKKISDLEKEFLFNNFESVLQLEKQFIYSVEDNLAEQVKYIIATNLNSVEKNVLLMYLSEGSFPKLAKRLGISTGSAFRKFSNIRQKIKTALDDNI